MAENLKPAEPEQLIAVVGACLALVRPVGMTEEDTRDWLAVASSTLEELPLDLLEMGAREARAKCTHHGQIVPTIWNKAEEWLLLRRRAAARERAPALALVQREPEPRYQITQADVDAMSPTLLNLGLGCGAVIENGDGTFSPAPNAA